MHASNVGGDLNKFRKYCNDLGIDEDAIAAGDEAVACCLELAGKAHNTIPSLLEEFEAIASSNVQNYTALEESAIQSVPRTVEDYLCADQEGFCLLYTSPSPRDPKTSRMPSSA